jgi:hypothetical protein
MSTINRRINADKAGIIAHLQGQHDYHKERAARASTQKEANRQHGVAEGLWLAIEVLKDWTLPDNEGHQEKP